MSVVRTRFVAGVQAGLFVLLTLAAWWAFASLSSTVVSCVPWTGQFTCKWPFEDRSRLDVAIKITVLMVSLFAAIWVSHRMFYTAETYKPKADPAGGSK